MEMGSAYVGWSVEVDEPADEGAGHHADSDDDGDRRGRRAQIVVGRQRALRRLGHQKSRRPWAFSIRAAIRSGR